MKRNKVNFAILTALATNGVVAADVKEEEEVSGLETIIITATKRAESIQEIPVAAAAISGETMENLGIDNFQEYVEFLPNVVFQGTGPGQNEIYIRGAATVQTQIAVSSVQALQPSVAFYLDEQPVSMQGRNLDIYAADMQRIEVLPGPQGTLFGASSQAGTIRMITNKPDHAGFSGGLDTSYSTTSGGEASYSSQGFLNLVLTDDLAIRITGYNDHAGGWIDNVRSDPANGSFTTNLEIIERASYGSYEALASSLAGSGLTLADIPTVDPNNSLLAEDDYNDATYSGARFALSYNLDDDWNVLLQHTAQKLSTEGVFYYDANLEGKQSTNRYSPDFNDDEFGLTTWTLTGRAANLDIVYTGGYLDRDIRTTVDYTRYAHAGIFAVYYLCNYNGAGFGAIPANEVYCADPTRGYSEETETTRNTHEFRVHTDVENPWRLTAGVYLDEQVVATVGQFQLGSEIPRFTSLQPNGFLERTLPGSDGTNTSGDGYGPTISFVNDITHTIDQIAVFGQLEFDLSDTVTAAIGARWYEIEDSFKGSTSTVDVSGRLQAWGIGTQAALEEFHGVDEAAVLMAALAAGEVDNSLVNDDGVLVVDDVILRATIDWKMDDDTMLFATWSEGFRPPVTNRVGGAPASNQTGAFEGFRIPIYSLSDKLTNYELGIKSTMLDNTLRMNATWFFSEIDNLQTSRLDTTNISFLVFTDNVGDADITGLDVDFAWMATDDFTITGAFSLLDSELTRINPEIEGIAPPVGSSLPYSAEFSGNIQAEYMFNISGELNGYVRGGFSYTGDRLAGMLMDAYLHEDASQLIYGTGSGLEIQREADVFSGAGYPDRNGDVIAGGRYVQKSYVLANITFGITKDDWKAELFIKNLTNENAQLQIDTQYLGAQVVTNRPRQIGVNFSYDFY
jgi:iron complex outermembrane receptor protein